MLESVHHKRILKEGMTAFYSGTKRNPYPPESLEGETWQYGFTLAKESWAEWKKEPPSAVAH